VDVRAEDIEWGFVVRSLPTAHDGKNTFVESRDLMDDVAVGFCRIRVQSKVGDLSSTFCILGHMPSPGDEVRLAAAGAALLQAYPDAMVVVPHVVETGFARLEPNAGTTNELLAAAVGICSAVGSWDESEPIVVTVGAARLDVRPKFDGEKWAAQVHAVGA
jgi:hypothetical protein